MSVVLKSAPGDPHVQASLGNTNLTYPFTYQMKKLRLRKAWLFIWVTWLKNLHVPWPGFFLLCQAASTKSHPPKKTQNKQTKNSENTCNRRTEHPKMSSVFPMKMLADFFQHSLVVKHLFFQKLSTHNVCGVQNNIQTLKANPANDISRCSLNQFYGSVESAISLLNPYLVSH